MNIKDYNHIVLIGPMGAGKTTIGTILAKKLELPFFDVDNSLEKKCGVSVNVIFDIEKEQGFRTRETQMLSELLAKPKSVIATGGGIVVTEENIQLLDKSNCLVIYLKTDVNQQLYRLRKDKKRPLLQVNNRKQKLMDMALIRNPLYESVATVVVKTGFQSPHKMASLIIKRYFSSSDY